MKTLLSIALLFTGLAFSQSPAPETTLQPFGGWIACQIQPQLPGGCAAQTASTAKPYLLSIYGGPSDAVTVAYLYTVTGSLVDSGVTVTQSAIVQRADNADGFTSVGLDFGGEIAQPKIVITHLAPTRISTGIPVRKGR